MKGSLWEKVTTGEGQPEPYGVPLVIVTKNCKKVAIGACFPYHCGPGTKSDVSSAGVAVGGYQISDLEDALKPHFDQLLWGGDKKKKRKTNYHLD